MAKLLIIVLSLGIQWILLEQAMITVDKITSEIQKHSFLCQVYWLYKFNNWEWVDDFPIEKPANWDDLEKEEKKENKLFLSIFNVLSILVPNTEFCRYIALISGKTNADFVASFDTEFHDKFTIFCAGKKNDGQ